MPIKWDIPKKTYKGERIVDMAPLDFLSKVPSPCREGVSAKRDINRKGCFSKSSITFITNKVKEGEMLDIPFLDFERPFRGFPSHEGRHTALVAETMGVKEIPVLVLGKK